MRKLLALILSLLMVFSLIPMTMASAEGENYFTIFDASAEDAASHIGTGNINGKVTIVDLENEDHPKAFYVKRTGEWNGFAGAFTGNIRDYAKGVIGIKFWVAGDEATVAAGQSFSTGIGTDSLYYRSIGETRNNFGPLTTEGAYYTWMWNSGNVYKNNNPFQSTYQSTAAKTVITEQFLATAKTRFFIGTGQYGNTEKQNGYQSGMYVDDIQFIYPEGVTPAPVEFTATFVGTETAQLAEDVAPIKSDAANNDAVVMPEATLVDGELAGWATAAAPTTVIAPGETTTIKANTTFYAVRVNKPALETPAKPVAKTIEGSKVVLEAISGAVYSKDGATWQTSNEFTGLAVGTTYTFYAKMSETLTHAESAVSEGLTVTTPVEYKFTAKDCSPAGYLANGTKFETKVSSNTDNGISYPYVQDPQTAVGHRVEFTVTGLESGVYSLTTFARNVNTRSVYEVTAVDSLGNVMGSFGNVDFKDQTYKFSGAQYHSANYLPNEVAIEQDSFKLIFTCVTAGSTGFYLDSFKFAKVGDLTTSKVFIDGEEIAVLDKGATYVIPTPETGKYYVSGDDEYFGGEEVVLNKNLNLKTKVKTTKVVYTMDEGKQMASASTANIGYGKEGAEYLDVNGDMKLALKVKTDQRGCFKLPEGWAKIPYYKAVKITFEAGKNIEGTLSYKNLDFSSKIGSANAPAGDVYKIATSLISTPNTFSIPVDESMYDYNYISGQYYASASWSESAPVYNYIDNVTIHYVYDFDYVAPVEATVTIDGEVVATVMTGDTFVLPELEAGKYYVGYEGVTEIKVMSDIELTTATYTYDITIDGEVVATVDYGTEYTLPALAAGKYYVDTEETTFVVTEDKAFTTATYTYDITIDGEVKATVDYGTEYTLPALHHTKYYVGVEDTTFVVTEDMAFTTAVKDVVDSLSVYDADVHAKNGAIAMWGPATIVEYEGKKALQLYRGDYMNCGGTGVSDANMFGSFTDYATTAIGVRFWAAAASDEITNPLQVRIGNPSNVADNFTSETLVGETAVSTEWTQYTVIFSEAATAEEMADMKYILFTTMENKVKYYVDDVELLLAEEVDSSCNITVDGVVVDTVDFGTTYTLPTLEAGKYYVDVAETTFVVTEDMAFTTAVYTYDITIDGEVKATVEYGTEYTLPALEAGKYYVGNPETTFVVTEALSFTTATYTYDVTIDGVVVATVAYGETYTLPALDADEYYVGVTETTFVVTSNLEFTTAEIVGDESTVVTTQDKAAIRLDSDVQGIRFYTTINLEGLDVEEVGTLIGPSDLAGDYLTMEDEQAGNAVKVEYDLSNGLYDDEYVVGSLVGIKEKNWARDFSARAYVILTDGTVLYSAATSTRNLAYIADAFIADANSNYNTLGAALKASVDAWAAAND